MFFESRFDKKSELFSRERNRAKLSLLFESSVEFCMEEHSAEEGYDRFSLCLSLIASKTVNADG